MGDNDQNGIQSDTSGHGLRVLQLELSGCHLDVLPGTVIIPVRRSRIKPVIRCFIRRTPYKQTSERGIRRRHGRPSSSELVQVVYTGPESWNTTPPSSLNDMVASVSKEEMASLGREATGMTFRFS